VTKVVQRAATYRRQLGATGLLVLVAFGALLQAGVLAPKLHNASSGGGGPLADGGSFYGNILQNVSWPSWTVTGVHLSGKRTTQTLRGGGTVEVGLAPGTIFGPGSPPVPPLQMPRLTVRPGQEFSVVLFHHQRCPAPPSFANIAAAQSWQRAHPQPTFDVKAYIDLGTALGQQTITTTFHVSCAT
jgi:hypothetical protein